MVGDLDAEPDELVLVGFSNPTDIVVGTLVNDISFGLIVDDDGWAPGGRRDDRDRGGADHGAAWPPRSSQVDRDGR